MKDLYAVIPSSARLLSVKPFRTTNDGSQAGVPGKMRRKTAHFLWFCLMRVTETPPDSDPIFNAH